MKRLALALALLTAAPSASAAPIRLDLPIQKATLDNGLRVVMSPEKTSHTVAIAMMMDVGSKDEDEGKTGLSRLVADLTFSETKNLGRGELQTLVRSHAGLASANAQMGETVFLTVLPENALALGLWLEAEKLRHFAPTAESLQMAKQALGSELAARSDDERQHSRLLGLVFQGAFPFSHSAAGSRADLERLTLGDVLDFHKRHYGPNRAALVLTGDFDPDMAMSLVHRYFDGVGPIQAPHASAYTAKPQSAERRAAFDDGTGNALTLSIGFSAPNHDDPSYVSLALAAIVLGDGEGSRLHSLLVDGKDAPAKEVSARLIPLSDRGPSLFRVDIVAKAEADAKELQSKMEKVLTDLAARPVTDAELKRAKARLASQWIRPLDDLANRAEALARYELHFTDARQLLRSLEPIEGARAEALQAAVAQWLAQSRCSIVETTPKPTPAASGGTSKAGPLQ